MGKYTTYLREHDLVGTGYAAKALGVDRSQLHGWMHAGAVKSVKFKWQPKPQLPPTSHWAIERSELNRILHLSGRPIIQPRSEVAE